MDDLENLDRQELVHLKYYKPIEVEVTTVSGSKLKCRTYEMLSLAHEDNQPSPQYLSIIVMGAKECGLPEEYIGKLENIEHNGYSGPVEVYDKIMANRK